MRAFPFRFAVPSFAVLVVAATGCGGNGAAKTTGGGGGGTSSQQATTSGAGGRGGAPGTGGGGKAGGPSTGTGGGLPVGKNATVSAFDATPVYFTGSDNKRVVDVPAKFPETGTYSKVTLHLALTCPNGGCDPYDRFGTIGVVTQPGTDGGANTVVELQRFITPFGVGASWDLDVTDLRPLLAGSVTLEAFIDTWVGPGSPYGGGWLLTASFDMVGGVPAKLPVSVVPVWTRTQAVYGDPKRPIATVVAPATAPLPAGASSYELRTFITGHGQGNAENCAEFCSRNHTITVDGTPHTQTIWRADCATTAAPNQQGTYQYSRGGWCPGADVKPWTFDVTADVAKSGTPKFSYDVDAYVNTCRPDAAVCTGCTLGTSCAYDGGTHTEPSYYVSTLLIGYR